MTDSQRQMELAALDAAYKAAIQNAFEVYQSNCITGDDEPEEKFRRVIRRAREAYSASQAILKE